MSRLLLAIRAFFRILSTPAYANRVAALDVAGATPQRYAREAVQLLALLQREGRLLDFLQEEIEGFDDGQVGAACRSVHRGCRKILAEYFGFEQVRSEQEGAVVTVPPGFDPSAIRLVGAVAGSPPYRGALAHHGWRATKAALPEIPAGQDPNIVAPAEVEIATESTA